MDVVVWLRSLGLEKYEAAFRENEIDETILPSLTEEHLKQLGVTALGHRCRIRPSRQHPLDHPLQHRPRRSPLKLLANGDISQ
jgi:hypothetical protein